MPYIRSLDGIRGLAVLLVLLFHGGVFPVGWVGVQIFFVLSGYLITTILLQQRDKSLSDYLGRFYWRRSLRIFPVYFCFLAVVTLAYLSIREPAALGRDWPFLVTYSTNFGRLRETDIAPQYVHLWSLAVEEQFYFVWPIVIYSLSITLVKRAILGILIFSPIIRLALYFCFQGEPEDWIGRNIYCLPISQFDAFATGAAIALWNLSEIKSANRCLYAAVSATALCGALVLAHEHFAYKSAIKWSFGYAMLLMPVYGFVWGYPILNFASGSLVIAAMQRQVAVQVLELWPLVRIGKISYGVYIYHLPLLFLLRTTGIPSGWLLVAAYLIGTMVVAETSFRILEQPLLRLKDRPTPAY